jgi:hypothetical protein
MGRRSGGSSNKRGGGRGRMGGQKAAGPDGYCVCTKCGHKIKHITGKPCNKQKCPKCGLLMTRK